ncbi:ATP-binding protein [Mycolicibacterium sp. lyk4-40-TYG-92]|uniref:ATP-binding protein n=1 Tax=Mycolicibacterium sp. lyk4-40-TYG-92 TaxID=3040295 RepID=UPI00254E4DF0|nr:ATP-binding protein [Mycolicibacterium sp. lyk4-40-TYG-92]
MTGSAAVAMDSRAYLLGWATVVEERVRTLVAHRRSVDPTPDDQFRGLYISDATVDALLGERQRPPRFDSARRDLLESNADSAEAAGAVLRLRALARTAGLTADDVELLVIALLPDLDSRFERFYGYLNDDVTRRRATVGLALELADLSPLDAAARARLSPGAPLVDLALVLIEEQERPFLTRGLRVPDRVSAHLLGDDEPDSALTGLLTEPHRNVTDQSTALAKALLAGQRFYYLRETGGCSGAAIAADGLYKADRPVLLCDARRLVAAGDPAIAVAVLGREAVLGGAGLVISPVEPLSEHAARVMPLLARLPVPVVLVGTSAWDPAWSDDVPLVVETARLTTSERTELWKRQLGALADTVDVDDLASQFAFGPKEVAAAIDSAHAAARLDGGTPTNAELRRGARLQNAAGLERLSRRVAPGVSWDDLVLPDNTLEQLQELTVRARYRERVLRDWRMRPGGGRGSGVTALFAGDSGTGKTMAAEVIAGDLGLDLYAVDLATVVDKYIGETEKNLERIFTEASNVSAVLLFDEADAIFGKRSEVRDAHDRYANIESAYLLQRMESFDGVAILATNLRANLDDAFTRRLDMVVDFPMPDEQARLALWKRCLEGPVPAGTDLRLNVFADAFPLAGGNIRSAAITAAYMAAGSGRDIDVEHLTAAIHREYRKQGRLLPTTGS